MPDSPRFVYFLSSPAVRVLPDSDDWHRPLPLARDATAGPSAGAFCHGDYFHAARSFFEQGGLAMVAREFGRRLQKPLDPGDIEQVRICLEKHGAFYHPARVEAVAGDATAGFVLNVAVSETGRRHIDREYGLLRKLNAAFKPSFLPRVYGRGEVAGPHNRPLAMFLGQWFDGCHEVHLARKVPGGPLELELWGPAGGRVVMTPAQTADFYRQAARILTVYYNLQTFEHIGLWHHAAGDFVVRREPSGLEVRLITVRQYAPLFADSGPPAGEARDAGLILQALLIFFLNLSLRMRLDRLAGVGDMVWAPAAVVESTLAGLLAALARKPPVAGLPDSPRRCFLYYLSTCSGDDLLDLCRSLADTFNARPAEAALVKRHLGGHVAALVKAIAAATT